MRLFVADARRRGQCVSCLKREPRPGSSRCERCLERIAGYVWRGKIARRIVAQLTCRHGRTSASDCRLCKTCVRRWVRAHEPELRERARAQRSAKVAAACEAHEKFTARQASRPVVDGACLACGDAEDIRPGETICGPCRWALEREAARGV